MCSFELKVNLAGWYLAWIYHYGLNIGKITGEELKKYLETDSDGCEFKQCGFLKIINEAIDTKGWVDIEDTYYMMLKSIMQDQVAGGFDYFGHPEKLNDELSALTKYLIEYLKEIQNNGSPKKNDSISKIFYGPILQKDISVSGQAEYYKYILRNLQLPSSEIKEYNNRYYGYYNAGDIRELEEFAKSKFEDSIALKKIMHDPILCENLSFPDRVFILNFNYTNTENLYTSGKYRVDIVHIHGELDDPERVIFGYGDELDKEYRNMQEKNENEYLKKIKSIRYMESDNYRKLFSFIESDYYQIYILGHSCGNSDRTLLNTLFEHRNCVSIKPYYYQYGGRDNYLNIIENISRNFTDMQRMRDIVVNKTFCQAMPQNDSNN